MKFSNTLIVAAAIHSASSFAAPSPDTDTASHLLQRIPIVTCRPKLNGKTVKEFRVDVIAANAQATRAGLTTGKSGDPHRYFNGDKIVFGSYNCDKNGAILWEYPVYWIGKNAQWQKDVKTDKQPGGPTPLRIVYSNSNGGIQYCGIMTHSEVNDKNQGLKFFQKCI